MKNLKFSFLFPWLFVFQSHYYIIQPFFSVQTLKHEVKGDYGSRK